MENNKIRQLTPEEWHETANYTIELAKLVEKHILDSLGEDEGREAAIREMQEMAHRAAAACIYVGDFAAEGVTFSVVDAKEGDDGRAEG